MSNPQGLGFTPRPAISPCSPRTRLPRMARSQAEVGSLPRPGNAADGDKFLELVEAANAKAPQDARADIDDAAKSLLRKFASGARASGPGRGAPAC